MKHHIELAPYDSAAALATAARVTRDPGAKTRLGAIVLRKQGRTPQEIAKIMAITDRSVTGWISAYNAGGKEALATKPSGRKEGNPKWDASLFEDLATEIDKGGYWSIPRMQEWIAEHHSVAIPEQTVWYRMDQLNYSYKGARPHPTQGNLERQEAFKKGGSPRSWGR